MQRADDTSAAKSVQRGVKSSTTLNRKYVKRPVKQTDMTVGVQRSSQIRHFSNQLSSDKVAVRVVESKKQEGKVQQHPLQVTANTALRSQRVSASQQKERKMTAKEIKDQAIQRALMSASTVEQVETAKKSKKQKLGKVHFGFGRVMLALSCAAVAVLAIVYFVNLNMPDISLKVAAMQTGINATYPGYIPRGYAVSSITSESRRISLDFRNESENKAFRITEETSSWDSNALLNNYVKETYGENYKTVKEQGLTIYISGSNAAWVNGGVVYKITTKDDNLTNKQICNIATSL